MKHYLKSREDEAYKLIYEFQDFHYYTVAYLNSRSTRRKYITLCVSSQVGCRQACRFCATGNYRYIQDLSADKIYEEMEDGLDLFSRLIREESISEVHVIFEGMGEASDNFNACKEAFRRMWESRLFSYAKVIFRVSTVGKVSLIPVFEELVKTCSWDNVEFQIKLSLHTPVPDERYYLFANRSLVDLQEIVSDFCNFADRIKSPLICNYMLMNYPDGRNNYDDSHLGKLSKLLRGKPAVVLLGHYSETKRGFSSPEPEIYEAALFFLKTQGIDTYITQLKGQDIGAACGMLNYCE